jgi:glycerophosphoryl diester phosphodiesterase
LRPTPFSIGHRGAALGYPEHTRESYEAAARMGAGIIECDVTFTKDRELVCRHSQCDLHTTTNILETPLAAKCATPFAPADREHGKDATARCCTSDLTLSEFETLCGKMDGFDPNARTASEYVRGGSSASTGATACGKVMSHAESIALIGGLGRSFIPELKAPSVPMPFAKGYDFDAYAGQLIDEYQRAGVAPERVFPQSASLRDISYWLTHAPRYAKNAVYLDELVDEPSGYDRAVAALPELRALGVRTVAPPLWALVTLDAAGNIVPSAYAVAAKQTGLALLTWTLERPGSLARGGGYYYQSVSSAITNDGDIYVVLDVLAQRVGIRGIFSDWPATVTYYADCVGL